VEIAGLRVGNRVKRGPHWTFGNQDGGNGKLGTVVEFRRWRADDDGIIGARVRWDDNDKVNTYRWPLNQSFPVDISPTGDDVPLESIHVPAYEDDFAAIVESHACDSQSKQALLRFFRDMAGRKWKSKSGWSNPASDPCLDRWEGVACSFGHVIAIELSSNSLAGKLSDSLSDILSLQSVSLSYNDLQAGIPLSYCKLRSLKHLAIDASQLTGTIPPCLSDLKYIETMSLHSNDIYGKVPAGFGKSMYLTMLHLHGNPRLEGPVDASLRSIPSVYVKPPVHPRKLACTHSDRCSSLPPGLQPMQNRHLPLGIHDPTQQF
jgi:hypothetical protein